MRTKYLHMITLAALLLLSGCVSFDIGIAKVGLDVGRFRIIPEQLRIELDCSAYAELSVLTPLKALLNMDKEVLAITDTFSIMPLRTEGEGNE